jgi:hypothetical protein
VTKTDEITVSTSKMLKPNDQSDSSLRFRFGKNWKRFLAVHGRESIEIATEAVAGHLRTRDLTGKRFLDIGSRRNSAFVRL